MMRRKRKRRKSSEWNNNWEKTVGSNGNDGRNRNRGGEEGKGRK
jgi:hypothetical protein